MLRKKKSPFYKEANFFPPLVSADQNRKRGETELVIMAAGEKLGRERAGCGLENLPLFALHVGPKVLQLFQTLMQK